MYPKIPNYNLQSCYDSIQPLQKVPPLTMRKSLTSLRMRLWDEKPAPDQLRGTLFLSLMPAKPHIFRFQHPECMENPL